MATLVKEKQREKKKKPKVKPSSSVTIETEAPMPAVREEHSSSSILREHDLPPIETTILRDQVQAEIRDKTGEERELTPQTSTSKQIPLLPTETNTFETITREHITSCDDLNNQLDSINISYDEDTASPNLSHFELNSSPEIASGFNENISSEWSVKNQLKLADESSSASVFNGTQHIEPSSMDQTEDFNLLEDACPSAPIFDEPCEEQMFHPNLVQTLASESRPKLQCMPLEEAVRLFGGAEMCEVRAMSEREEAIVEAGPMSGPEHPLVDLLSTFRCSLKSVERVRGEIVRGYREEEISRSSLWKVERRRGSASQSCKCGETVRLQVSYEHAELQTGQLPAARMRLEALARDVQDSYCHHQHLALLTHCQIEELISETVQGSKNHIREALALVLRELKVADSAPPALAAALQRWARTLASALVDARDLRQLLFLLHHLCRQTRSVRWAARLVRVPASDSIEVARVIALLELLLCGHMARVEPALECTEERDEAWEEVDARGGGGAVADGALRERDLLALLRALPLAELAARLALLRHRDMGRATAGEWGDASGGRGVLKAACGARALLAVLARAAAAHAPYRRLRAALARLAARAVHALADLHLHARASYLRELEPQISAELEATFAAAFTLLASTRASLLQLPFRLLPPATAMAYCIGLIILLHEPETKPLEGVGVAVPAWLGCGERVRIVAHACADRTDDYELARNVLEFLFQTGVKAKSVACAGGCAAAARECVAVVLRAHPALYPAALHILADLHQVDNLTPAAVGVLAPHQWRPGPQEVNAVLADWAQRCLVLLPTLLLSLDCTPHTGLALDTQLAVGGWLCSQQRALPAPPAPPEWAWRALRRLRTHRAWWAGPGHAPPPAAEGGLFQDAFNLLATDWGHCVPVICRAGVAALARLAAAGRARDAAHCLAPALRAMADAPDSVSMTEEFGGVVSVLAAAGPTLLQRALRRAAEPGAALLLKTLARELADTSSHIPAPARACVWLHLVWARGGACAALLEAVALHSEPRHLAAQVEALQARLSETERMERVRELVRNAATCPCACAAALAALAAAQGGAGGGAGGRLLDALHQQLLRKERIHVDNAMKLSGWSMSSEDLAIHLAATAATAAPHSSPGQLDLWLLFFQLYLQRPPCDMRNTAAPVGPLFFSGINKSRTLAYLKRRLQEAAAFHQAEAARLKAEEKRLQPNVPPRGRQTRERTEDAAGSALDDEFLKAEVLVAEVSDDDNTSGSDSDEVVEPEDCEPPAELKRLRDLMLFHSEAEIVTKTYVTWLEEGDKVRASPHSLRPLTERARQAGCAAELQRVQPPSSPEDEDPPSGAPVLSGVEREAPLSPLQRAVRRLQEYEHSERRGRRRARSLAAPAPAREEPREEPRSPRALLAALDAQLRALDALAEQWSSDARQVSLADGALWPLVGALRARRPLPARARACANKCTPLTLCVQEYEWCVSPGAERGIQENRAGARAAVRRLARPRRDAARAAAALHALCRQVREAETATLVLERAWRCGGSERVARCAPARMALSALVEHLAERWICHDAGRCGALAAAWCGAGGALQRSLAAALLSPRRLPPAAWVDVYTTLLRLDAPPDAAFSFLSKFEITRWAAVASAEQRRVALAALFEAAQAHGPAPDDSYGMLIELIGVHTAALIDDASVCEASVLCARAAAAARLPPAHWPHLLRAAAAAADHAPFDQLGHTLRALGETWWAARAEGGREGGQFVAHAAPTAKLIRTLLLAFVAAAHRQRYSVDRVAYYGWCALQQAWAPWVTPCSRAALLPADDPSQALPPQQMCRALAALLAAAAGAEDTILHEVFVWVSGLFPVGRHSPAERGRLAALLAELGRLPWRGGWLAGRAVPALVQTCLARDAAAWAWTSGAVSGARAADWTRGVPDEHAAPHLAAVFFVATTLPLDEETIEEASQLAWWRLPAAALEPALERFFADHHSPAAPYHALPQFKLVLYASELAVHQSLNAHACRAGAAEKRLATVSMWVRAASDPSLRAHVADSTRCLLDAVTRIAPCLASVEGEVEALLARAVTILCTEPAGALSLPVWQQWVSAAPPPLPAACVSAAATLTVLDHCAALADAAIKALLLMPQSGGWAEASRRWAGCHWREPVAMATRGRPHAAYASALAHAQTDDSVRAALCALAAGKHNFVESEAILALLACYACRVAAQAGPAGGPAVGPATGPATGPAEGCRAAGGALLAAWAGPRRRSLLSTLGLRGGTDSPTDRLRLLCQYAQCVLAPADEALARAFESACACAGAGAGPLGDVGAWARAPRPRRLPLLAVRLFPASEVYFRAEMELTPDE